MIDWDDAFDNSGYVPGSDALLGVWRQEAAAFRAGTPVKQLDVAYGPHERERLDLFGDATKGTVVFVHGGYWQMLEKSVFSHLAAGCLARSWAVAILSYPLAPDTAIPEITKSIARAVTWVADNTVGPIVLAGHSAGGHLVSRMACRDTLPVPIAKRLQRVVSISGIHDLRPLTLTKMNDTLRLSQDEAATESPACHSPRSDTPLSFWVGADERPELLRQTRLIAENWSRQGADVSTQYDPGQNHFSVITALTNPNSALTQELTR